MGLTHHRARAAELLAHHRHVYFSDLRGITMGSAALTGRLFYGCVVAPETFAEATRAGSCFVCCAGAGAPLDDGYKRGRRALYQLYYLLVHVNLFGAGYEAGSLAAAHAALAG
jgi:hypothetical protein